MHDATMWFGFADANNDGALEPGEFPLAVFPFLRPEGRREEYFHKQALLWMGECMRASWRCCGWARDGGRGMLRAVRPCGCAAMPCAAALTRWTPCPRQPRPADHHFMPCRSPLQLHGADKVVDTLTLTRLPVCR